MSIGHMESEKTKVPFCIWKYNHIKYRNSSNQIISEMVYTFHKIIDVLWPFDTRVFEKKGGSGQITCVEMGIEDL